MRHWYLTYEAIMRKLRLSYNYEALTKCNMGDAYKMHEMWRPKLPISSIIVIVVYRLVWANYGSHPDGYICYWKRID